MTMEGFPDFHVITEEIDGTIYTVYGSYSPDANETVTEKAIRIALRDLDANLSVDAQAAVNQIIESSRQDIPSDEQLRAYYRKQFIEIGFSEAEVAELMAKIEEHLQTRRRAFERRR